ncbi:MAG: ATP-binding protein [Eggerthellaceae bacterium]|jgi:hypothetical protein
MDDQSLPQFLQEVTGDSHLRVEADLGDGFVRLRSSEAERRQAKQDIRSVEDIVIEMLRNARDAGAHLVYLATAREGARRTLTFIDDGCGIPASLFDAVFEPRVTSKLDTFHSDRWGVHGRGMALYGIRMNAERARVVASAPGKGSSLQVVADTGKLPERADQSAIPHLVLAEDGRMVMRGPRNINRMVAEFVVEEQQGCQVFLGSPIEVVASMVDAGTRALSIRERTFVADPEAYPLCLRPALAADPEELAALSRSLGLDMSERSARRILDGQVAPLQPFLSVLYGHQRQDADGDSASAISAPASPEELKRASDPRGLRITRTDIARLQEAVQHAWAPIAQSYYLDGKVKPQVRVTKEGVRIFIPAVKEK